MSQPYFNWIFFPPCVEYLYLNIMSYACWPTMFLSWMYKPLLPVIPLPCLDWFLDSELEALNTVWVTEILECFLHADITAVFSSMLFLCLFGVLYTADTIPAPPHIFLSQLPHMWCFPDHICYFLMPLYVTRHNQSGTLYTWSPVECQTWCYVFILLSR